MKAVGVEERHHLRRLVAELPREGPQAVDERVPKVASEEASRQPAAGPPVAAEEQGVAEGVVPVGALGEGEFPEEVVEGEVRRGRRRLRGGPGGAAEEGLVEDDPSDLQRPQVFFLLC